MTVSEKSHEIVNNFYKYIETGNKALITKYSLEELKQAKYQYSKDSYREFYRAIEDTEEHSGHWKDCQECRNSFETEMYIWYGTNEYNFEKLENPPKYEPTKCARCGIVIRLGEDGYSTFGRNYFCEACTNIEHEKQIYERL